MFEFIKAILWDTISRKIKAFQSLLEIYIFGKFNNGPKSFSKPCKDIKYLIKVPREIYSDYVVDKILFLKATFE